MSGTLTSPRESMIRRGRIRAGVGVRQLARQLGVTPAAVSEWERSEVRGTAQLNTIDRALSALGEAILVGSRRVTTVAGGETLERREERVALELHRAVARKLVDDPQAVFKVMSENIERLRGQVRGESALSGLDEWAELGELRSVGGLIDVMLGTDRRSIDMRQSSPFLGVLTQTERLEAIGAARQHEAE
jgi:transcriptional regulator with XRE-family HTH domain